MNPVLYTALMSLSIMGLIVQVIICLVLLRMFKTYSQPQIVHIPVVVPAANRVIAQIPATVLRGGAVRFVMPDGSKIISDFDGDGPFTDWAGVDMIVTYQEADGHKDVR